MFRVAEKLILDGTGFVHFRHPFHAGGVYYIFNAVMTHIACFVAASLYSTYSTSIAPDYNTTGGNYASEHAANTTATLPVNGSAAVHAGANSSKIGDLPLFVAIGTLVAVWTIAFLGFLLTMKREYRGSFVSTQTGRAYAQAHFLDHDGDDARRVHIFHFNEQLWRSIRYLVRHWVLGAYATWLQLSPAWFTNALRALIPDDLMPAPVVQQLDAQTPGGRRLTLHNMGMQRRVSLVFGGAESGAAEPPAPFFASALAPDSEPEAAPSNWH